jgi:hypothetical protein
MPDAISDSGDMSGASVVTNSDGSVLLTGRVEAVGTGIEDGGTGNNTWAGTPVFQAGATFTDVFDDSPRLIGGVIFQAPASPILQGQVSQPIIQTQTTKQAVKLEIHNTVVQPLEPCRSVPYLKLVFLPVDETVRFERDLRREVSIPVPKKQMMTVAEYKSKFDGKVHTKDPRYLLRWKQILPVMVEPQDGESASYKSVDVYDLRTAVQLSDSVVIQWLDISELPLIQVTKAEDIQGGTMDSGIQNHELYLDSVFFADINQSTGSLIGKNPVEAGIFAGG